MNIDGEQFPDKDRNGDAWPVMNSHIYGYQALRPEMMSADSSDYVVTFGDRIADVFRRIVIGLLVVAYLAGMATLAAYAPQQFTQGFTNGLVFGIIAGAR